MKERPILFSAPMVRGLLDGSKTQTRRVITPQPTSGPLGHVRYSRAASRRDRRTSSVSGNPTLAWWQKGMADMCPYGRVGDRLWVRETHAKVDDNDALRVLYRADSMFDASNPADISWQWTPSIFMPRWASRITLEITDVRVQRLQEISEADALEEGVMRWRSGWSETEKALAFLRGGEAREACGADSGVAQRLYYLLWQEINEKRAPWSQNDWVWVISFNRVVTT